MKIAVAQLCPKKGDIAVNIEKHHQLIQLALIDGATAIFFPELSLTSYEPTLAKKLVLPIDDIRLQSFQKISNQENIIVCLGIPTLSQTGIRISMVIFQPYTPALVYDKQQLHEDEFPYFESGEQQLILRTNQHKIAPAICYESLQLNHAVTAASLGATLYIASVAKAQKGIDKAMNHYPTIAKRFNFPVLIANCIGWCDNFKSIGKSAVWNAKGELLTQLGSEEEGIIVYDTQTEKVIERVLT